ncbi:serine hydrolase domain-containing protein [Chitinophaga skermanii]|nr:serine hydrolase domain-containing protein [Chitinophaga skermanii]
MKRFVICIWTMLMTVGVYAQDLPQQLLEKYNNRDFAGIYALGSEQMKQMESEKDFTSYLESLREETGSINFAKPLQNCNSWHTFEWRGEKKNLRVTWVMKDKQSFDDYFIDDVVMQPNSRRHFPHDNPLQSHQDSIVHNYATAYLLQANTAGMSIGILRSGKKYVYNYGAIRKNGPLPSADNIYVMGSIAKVFVGMMLSQAVVDKKAKFDDDVRKYLPGNYPNLQYNGTPIQLVQLANHTSGLPHDLRELPSSITDLPFLDLMKAMETYYPKDSLLHDLHQATLVSQPGTTYSYNGLAYHVLVAALETMYKQPYEQILTNFLKKNLNMFDTKIDLSDADMKRIVTGYRPSGDTIPMIQSSGFFYGGPRLNSTINDMLKFAVAQLSGKHKAMELSHHQTFEDKYRKVGISWMLGTNCLGQSEIFHTGSTSGSFNSILKLYPNQQSACIIFTNDGSAQNRLSAVERGIMLDL